jgi:hypothetical protein
MRVIMGSELDAVGTTGCKATVETYGPPVVIPDARTPEWKETAGNLPTSRQDALRLARAIPSINYMHVVPGSERHYCRVEKCDSFTWANVPYGYCETHLLQHLLGEMLVEKPFPPIGHRFGQ